MSCFFFFAKQEEILIRLNHLHPSPRPHTQIEGEIQYYKRRRIETGLQI